MRIQYQERAWSVNSMKKNDLSRQPYFTHVSRCYWRRLHMVTSNTHGNMLTDRVCCSKLYILF